ncbi:MAG: M20/M25/M40 family metallo-hydrolase [Ardenticatenaceae bacterium]|nr:M20/M25/M40 family metallo-hydrolase [Ardenticatenaceae bacterium]
MMRQLWVLALTILIIGSSCSLLEGPQQPTIPTPIPPASAQEIAAGELVFDPRSDIVPGPDPEIVALVNAASQQNLVAYVQTLEGFGTRNTYSATDSETFGIGATRLWIFNELVRVGNGRLQVQFDDFPVNANGITYNQQNIVARLPGTGDHAGVIVLMAHYDSRTVDPGNGSALAPGANDNASGVAALIEIARLLSSRSWSQDVVFVAFAAEEQGTHGSRHFVADRMLDGWVIDAAINNDIVGGRPGIPQSIRVFTAGSDFEPPRQLAHYMELIGGYYLPSFAVILEPTVDRPDRYSDHIRFLDAGIPALRLTESVEDVNTQHNGLDRSDLLDYSYLLQVTQLNLVTIANAIGAPPAPPAPIIAPMAEPGAYIVTWTPDPNAAGYALSFRPEGWPEYPPFVYVQQSQAGNVAITTLEPGTRYLVSMAAITENGRLGLFSPEIPVGPNP